MHRDELVRHALLVGLLAASLAACAGAADDMSGSTGTSDTRGRIPSSTPSPGGGAPERDGATGRGTGDGAGNGTGGGSDSGTGGGTDDGGSRSTLEVAGPTLDGDYPEYWGNFYPEDDTRCANFAHLLDADVTVVSLTVSEPLALTGGCSRAPDSGVPAPPCAAGVVIPPGGACGLTLRFTDSADRSRDFPAIRQTWELTTVCTGTEAGPCAEPAVVAAAPSPSNPVTIRWTTTTALRYCGATDYADDGGYADGRGTSPDNGCSGTPAPAPTHDQPRGDGSGTGDGSGAPVEPGGDGG